MYIIFVLICGIFPFVVTAENIICLVRKDTPQKKKHKWTLITLIAGTLLSAAVLSAISSFRWDEPVVIGEYFTELHEPFYEKNVLSLCLFALAAMVCLYLLDRGRVMPPLAAVICVSGVYGGIILGLFYISQLAVNILNDMNLLVAVGYLILFPVNFFIISARVIRETVLLYTAYFRENDFESKNRLDSFLRSSLEKAAGWVIFPLIGLIPFTRVLVCLCILCGQGPFGIIRAFTNTSDWTYSTMISPPPVEYEGHYLCTVAVNGHERVVKPLRLGVRHGVVIGVNRQLCAANAFEQLIEDKAPRLHRLVRHIYDKYGYPVSKHITTRLRADIVYILMKPLEWLFVAVLYLFDRDPESRIAVQYTDRHVREFTLKG